MTDYARSAARRSLCERRWRRSGSWLTQLALRARWGGRIGGRGEMCLLRGRCNGEGCWYSVYGACRGTVDGEGGSTGRVSQVEVSYGGIRTGLGWAVSGWGGGRGVNPTSPFQPLAGSYPPSTHPLTPTVALPSILILPLILPPALLLHHIKAKSKTGLPRPTNIYDFSPPLKVPSPPPSPDPFLTTSNDNNLPPPTHP